MTDFSQITDADLDAQRVALDEQIETLKAQLAEMNAEAGRRSLVAHEAVQAALAVQPIAEEVAAPIAPEGSATVVPDADVVH